jgi:tetratricopeptide (TPR) repeat protein
MIKPPPAVRTVKVELTAPELKRRRRNLIYSTLSVIAVLGACWGVYSYVTSAQERAGEQFQRGMRQLGPGSYAAAIASFNRALEIWPRLPDVYLERGFAYQYLGQPDAALADFNEALDLNPNLARAYTGRGTVFRKRGDVKGAITEFTKSIQIKPLMDSYYERGQAYESLGEHQRALEDFSEAIAIMPDAPFIYRSRAAARRSLGDIPGSEADENTAKSSESAFFHR